MDSTQLLYERELAARENDGYTVSLTWNARTDRLTITVDDSRTGESLSFAPPRDKALDAFYHPFSYAAGPSPLSPARIAA